MAQSDHSRQALKPLPSLDYARGFNVGYERGVAEGQPYETITALIHEQNQNRKLRSLAWGLAIVLAVVVLLRLLTA